MFATESNPRDALFGAEVIDETLTIRRCPTGRRICFITRRVLDVAADHQTTSAGNSQSSWAVFTLATTTAIVSSRTAPSLPVRINRCPVIPLQRRKSSYLVIVLSLFSFSTMPRIESAQLEIDEMSFLEPFSKYLANRFSVDIVSAPWTKKKKKLIEP